MYFAFHGASAYRVLCLTIPLLAFCAWTLPAGESSGRGPSGAYDGPVKILYSPDRVPETPTLESLERTDRVQQYGITWTFDRPVRAGRFVTGDWYVVGPVTVIEIDPKPLFGEEVAASGKWTFTNKGSVHEDRYAGKQARNGCTLNQPVNTQRGGFDSRLSHGFYDPKLFTRLPVEMKPGDALISTISNPNLENFSGYGQPVLTAAVLTCMAEPQPADAFRPPYGHASKKPYLARHLRRDLLYRLPKTKDAPKDLSSAARKIQRPWLDTVAWGYASPKENMPRYGMYITAQVSHFALVLHMDYTPEEKEPLLIHTVQYGIDLWGLVEAGSPGWNGHGGFGGGRKWSIVFAGLMLDDPEMRAPNTKYPKVRFGEDQQTSWGKTWSGYDVVFESHPGQNRIPTELKHPREWVSGMSEAYRYQNTSVVWPGQALAARLMRAENYWNHDPFFAYVDRWMSEDHIAQLKELKQAAKDNPAGKRIYATWWDSHIRRGYLANTNETAQEMWDRYRKDLPKELGNLTPQEVVDKAK
ncbi:MAG: hypothetical protein AMXMBFR7_39310 [Planctomycetota bacterium]